MGTQTADVDKETLENKGAEAMFSALNWLQREMPDADVSFDMPAEQRLTVKRNGIRYAVRQLVDREDSGYVYGVGAELPTTDNFGRETTEMMYPRFRNACQSYADAVFLLAKVIMADPRQDGLTAWNDQPKDFTFTVTGTRGD